MLAWLGLGGNMDGPESRLAEALAQLRRMDGVELLRVSSFYRTPPWGDTEQDEFVNAAASVETRLGPLELLRATQAIEEGMGRRRGGRRWGPRVIDIDVLLYGDAPYRGQGLEIPHPRMHERAFVLVPLAELDPDLVVPGRGPVAQLLAGLDCSGIRRLAAGYAERIHDPSPGGIAG